MPGRELSRETFEAASHSLATGPIAPLPFSARCAGALRLDPADVLGPLLRATFHNAPSISDDRVLWRHRVGGVTIGA